MRRTVVDSLVLGLVNNHLFVSFTRKSRSIFEIKQPLFLYLVSQDGTLDKHLLDYSKSKSREGPDGTHAFEIHLHRVSQKLGTAAQRVSSRRRVTYSMDESRKGHFGTQKCIFRHKKNQKLAIKSTKFMVNFQIFIKRKQFSVVK